MRLLFISKYAVNPNYGVPSRQFFLAKYFSRIEENQVLLVSSRSTMVPDIPSFWGLSKTETFNTCANMILNGPVTGLGFNVKRLFSWLWFEFLILLKLPALFRFKPDVIMVSSLSILSFLNGILLKYLTKSPLVVEIRDIYPQTLVEIGGYSKKHLAVRFLAWVERKGYTHADLIISTLPNAKSHVEAVMKKEPPFLWLPMGFDPELYQEESLSDKGSNALEVIRAEKEKFKVGYSGTIGKANALDHLFEVAQKLHSENPSVVFLIIGDGPMREHYHTKYSKLSNIRFLGHIPKKELPHLLREMDVLVNPWLNKPIYRFGISPNKWIDYMKAARPILAPYNGYPFMLNEHNIGWFIEAENTQVLADMVNKLSRMPLAELDAMGKNGAQYLQANLSYASLANKLYKHLKDV